MSFIIGPTDNDKFPTPSPTSELPGQFHPSLYNFKSSGSNHLEIKTVVCGARGVGKSSLISQLVTGRFDYEYQPTIQDIHYVQLEDGANSLPLTLVDTPWDDSYHSLREELRSSIGLMILFAVDDRHSFEVVQEIHEYCLSCGKNSSSKTILLVANKCDLLSGASAAGQLFEGKQLAQRLGCEFWPISTKYHGEVLEVFQRFRDRLGAVQCDD